MDITYLGGSSFRLHGETDVCINPVDPRGEPGVCLYTIRKEARRAIVSGPGEYEISGVLIQTVSLDSPSNAVLGHAVDIDGTRILHLAGKVTAHALSALSNVGTVDVLLIDAGDPEAAARLIRDISPRTVLPFGAGAESVCASLGVSDLQRASKFTPSVTGKAPKAVLLKHPGRKRSAA